MDPHKRLANQQEPFYLCNPSRARFIPTSSQPLPLGAHLDRIRDDLLNELHDVDLPQRKKHSTLEHYLGRNGKYDMDEMIQDVVLSQFVQNGTGLDDCTLMTALKTMKTSHLSKTLAPLDGTQFKAFQLQPQPEGMNIIPVAIRERYELKQKKRLEKERIKREKRRSRESGNATPQCSLESGHSSMVDSPCAVIPPPPTVATLKSAPICSGTVTHQPQINKLAANACKKSIAAALKGVRGLSYRGRGRGRPTEGIRKYHSTAKPSGRGRGRPRKHPIRTHPAPVKVNLEDCRPTPPAAEPEEVSIKNFCELKMTFTLNRAALSATLPESSSPIAPVTSQLVTDSPKRPSKKSCVDLPVKRGSLICRIRLPKKPLQEQLEENADNEDDDKSLDVY